MRNVSGYAGYKCYSCPIVVCWSCANRIFYSNKNKSVNPHDLAINNRNSWKCD